MKKSLLLLLLLPILGATCFAQESRQDVSLSGSGIIQPFVSGNAVQLHSTVGYYGVLASYRYDLTPHGALEMNYQYNQDVLHFVIPTNPISVHERFQEFSGAYVRSFTFRNWNPFLEAGVAGVFRQSIDDRKTTDLDASSNTSIGGLYGGGIAYEISPSFDIRAEYRGLILKTPTFNFPGNDLRSNVYYNIYNPVIGVAYHF
jgi:outer membrane immunogenic protein